MTIMSCAFVGRIWHKQVFSWRGSYDIGLYSVKYSEEQSSRKLLKKCLTEYGKMIKMIMKFQDIFTRLNGILPDSVRRSDMYRKTRRIRIYHIYSKKRPGALQFRGLLMTLRQNVGKYTKISIFWSHFCILFSNFGQGKDFRLTNQKLLEPEHDKTNKMVCAPSKDADQPGHPPSLIRVQISKDSDQAVSLLGARVIFIGFTVHGLMRTCVLCICRWWLPAETVHRPDPAGALQSIIIWMVCDLTCKNASFFTVLCLAFHF